MNNTQKLMSEYRRQFHLAYHQRVLPLLARFETKRGQYLTWLLALEMIPIGGILYSVIRWKELVLSDIGAIIISICVVLMVFIASFISKKFTNELKKYCLKPILDIFGSIVWKEKAISNVDLEKSELFSTFNRRSTDDGFEGEYKGVKFEIAETRLGYESGSGKNRHYREVFRGVVIKFASNKQVGAKTMISTKGDRNIKRTGIWSILLSIVCYFIGLSSASGPESAIVCTVGIFLMALILIGVLTGKKNKDYMRPIHLEDPVFEKKFNAYSANEVEGRYLITTAFMERFINLNTAFGSKNAKCAFFDDTIMFAISTRRNLFEIGNLFSKLNNTKQLDKFFNEFASILLLVEHFKLNQKTGL